MAARPTLHVALPVYNEEAELAESVRRVVEYLQRNLTDYDWRVIIADNASTDRTLAIARELAAGHPEVDALHLPEKGRGRAVKRVWTDYPADISAYMDVDLSTDLKHLAPLVRSIARGYDVAIGTRNLAGARVVGRTLMRTITSKGYILLIRLMFPVHFSDAQCGFKAVSARVVRELLPRIVDDAWFFDTELLILAEGAGFQIYQEAVTWTDNPGSTVRVWKTVVGDLEGLWRLYKTQ